MSSLPARRGLARVSPPLPARLAVSAAAAGLKTLLVDADLRKPTQVTQFGLEVSSGLSEVLSTGAAVLMTSTAYGSLDVLAAGKADKINPEALATTSIAARHLARKL